MDTPRIEKRRVTCTNAIAVPTEDGTVTAVHEVVDYVPVDLLDAYLADAAGKWQAITVGDEHDPGPAGDEGLTTYPEHLEHPMAGLSVDGSGEVVEDVEAFHKAANARLKRKAR